MRGMRELPREVVKNLRSAKILEVVRLDLRRELLGILSFVLALGSRNRIEWIFVVAI